MPFDFGTGCAPIFGSRQVAGARVLGRRGVWRILLRRLKSHRLHPAAIGPRSRGRAARTSGRLGRRCRHPIRRGRTELR